MQTAAPPLQHSSPDGSTRRGARLVRLVALHQPVLTYTPPMEAETGNRVRRPAGLWLLTVALLTSPVFHLLALLVGTRGLNFGSHQPWDAFVYFVIAPVRRNDEIDERIPGLV